MVVIKVNTKNRTWENDGSHGNTFNANHGSIKVPLQPSLGGFRFMLLTQYLNWKAIETPHAAKIYELWIQRFFAHIKKCPTKATVEDFISFHKYWLPKVKTATLFIAMTAVRDFIKYLYENKHTETSYRYVPKVRQGTFGHHDSVSPEEVERMIATLGTDLRGTRDAAILSFLFDTGLRVSELISLDLSALDLVLKQGRVKTLKKRIKEEYRPFFWRTRTDILLKKYLEKRKMLTESPALWISLDKGGSFLGRITVRAIQRLVKDSARKASIDKKIVVHSFRHGHAIELIMKGGTNADVMNELGHSGLEQTKHYTLYNPKEARERYFDLLGK